MSIYNKKLHWIMYIFPIILMTDLLYLTIVPAEDGKYDYDAKMSRDSDRKATTDVFVRQLDRLYYFTGYGEKDYFNDIEATLTMIRNFGDYKSMIARNFNILLPVVCFGVIAYYLGYVIRKKKQQISLMAISIGGHAPPLSQ